MGWQDLNAALSDGAWEVMTLDEIRRSVNIGDAVDVTFTDGVTVTGTLERIDDDEIHVEHEYWDDNKIHYYTAPYSFTGDDATPAVVTVRPAPPQSSTLF